MLTSVLFRNLLLEFGSKVLKIPEVDLTETVAYKQYMEEDPQEASLLFVSRVLAYSPNTWKAYASSVSDFLEFCSERSVSMFDCTPSLINVYQLKLAQDGKTFKNIESKLNALSFLYKFFLMPNFVLDKTVSDVKRFAKKVCRTTSNKKSSFGSAEIRKMWDSIEKDKGGIEKLSKTDLRTFCLAVFQHKTFCRYSDIKSIKLSDVIFDADFFKIFIQYSKTDQFGSGSYVYLPKSTAGFRDAHMLLCLYIQKMDFPCETDVYLFPPLK